MILSNEDMQLIVDALNIAYEHYTQSVKDAIHSYDLNTGQLIKRKVAIEELLGRIGTRFG